MRDRDDISKYEKIVVGLLITIILIPAILLNILDISNHKLIIGEDTISVGTESFKIEDIKNVELVDDVYIKRRIKGTRTLKILTGLYELEDESKEASVYMYKNIKPYIKIELDKKIIIYNDKNSYDTKSTYDNLINSIN